MIMCNVYNLPIINNNKNMIRKKAEQIYYTSLQMYLEAEKYKIRTNLTK